MNPLPIFAALVLSGVWTAQGETTLNDVHRHAWSANTGWINAQGDVVHGAVIGESVCSGYLYSANCGWIQLGSGTPTNGIAYLNNSAGDFGVNHDGTGRLRGQAWSANLGWLAFENIGAPSVDLRTGKLTGHIYSANAGWISLSNAQTVVQTDVIARGADTDQDGMSDAWERIRFGSLLANPENDADGDHVSNLAEYLADTDPGVATSLLRIFNFVFVSGGALVEWNSRPTRVYQLQGSANLLHWTNVGSAFITAADDYSRVQVPLAPTHAFQFYRVESRLPLAQ